MRIYISSPVLLPELQTCISQSLVITSLVALEPSRTKADILVSPTPPNLLHTQPPHLDQGLGTGCSGFVGLILSPPSKLELNVPFSGGLTLSTLV